MASTNLESLLKISNSPVLAQFLHECVDDLIGKSEANFSNYNSDIEWTSEDYTNARKLIQNIFKQATILNDEFEMKNMNLPENVQKEIMDCFTIRKNEVFQALAEESVLDKDHKLVKSLDWRVKWIMGSSKLATIREPVAQLDLYYNSKKDHKKIHSCANFEMNLQQVDELIDVLSSVQKELKS